MDSSLTEPISSSEMDTQFKYKASPELLHLCVIDSTMPSPNRHLESNYESSSFSLASQFVDGDPVNPLSTSSPSKICNGETLKSPLSESLSPKFAKTGQQIGNPPSPQVTATHGEANPSKSPLSQSLPKGAWASPLKISTHLSSSTNASDYSFQKPEVTVPVLSPNEHWPALSKQQPQRNQNPPTAPKWVAKSIDAPIPTAPDILKASQEYPWAAKMRSICNLRRVTTPVFMEDGTPKVSIPSHVLLEGLENQKEFVIGQFYRCAAPSGGYIHGVVSRIWGRKCHIFARKLGESSYLFHIPDEATRKWVIQRGLWHVDDCLMFVSAWSPSPIISLPEISTIPVWLTLKNIPFQLYSIKGIDWIASAIGEPMLTSKPWLDPTQMGEAKILVEVKLNKQFPHKVAIEDESGSITMVDVVYSWLPSKCSSCGQLGHKSAYCLGLGIHSLPTTGSALASSVSPLVQDVAVASFSVNATAPTLESDCGAKQSAGVINAEPASLITAATAPISNEPLVVEPVYTIQTCLASSRILPLPGTEDSTSNEATAAATMPESTIIKAAVSHHTTTTTEGNKLSTISSESLSISEAEVISPSLVIPTSPEVTISPPLESYTVISTPPCVTSYEFEEPANSVTGIQEDPFALLDPMENDLNTELLEDVDNASNQRTLRERPVKPTQKAQENQWTVVGGRSNRGRRGRGGRGHHS